MTLYRIKQFYWGITAKIDLKDKRFLQEHLTEDEIKLFNKLTINEQKHSIKTAFDAKRLCVKNNINYDNLIKVALLHDIGKINYNMTLIEKSFMVLLNKMFKGNIKKYYKFKIVDTFYNHGDIGYTLLKNMGYDERFLYLVKNHHNNDIIGDKVLNFLKKCDDNN